jgi:hypothetical protein
MAMKSRFSKFEKQETGGLTYLYNVLEDNDEWFKRTALIRIDDFIDQELDKEEYAESGYSDEYIVKSILDLFYYLGWYSYDNGPGQYFANAPCAKIEGKSRKWVRVVQYGGRDI